MDGSPSEQGSNEKGGSFSATVQLKCKWNERYALLGEIVGGQALYPNLPDSGARAVSGTAKPHPGCTKHNEGDIGQASYDWAAVDITYKVQSETKDLISETLTPTLEMLTLDYRRFRWATASNSAIMPDPVFNRAINAVKQGMTQIQSRFTADQVDAFIDRVLANACQKKPGKMAYFPEHKGKDGEKIAEGILPVPNSWRGPSLPAVRAMLQPLWTAARNAWNLQAPQNQNQAKPKNQKNDKNQGQQSVGPTAMRFGQVPCPTIRWPMPGCCGCIKNTSGSVAASAACTATTLQILRRLPIILRIL